MHWDIELDCLGMLCPLPVLRARKRLIGMAEGQVLRLLASDAMAAIDLPHFCTQAGHTLLTSTHLAQGTAYLIQRGAEPAMKA